MKYLDEFHDPDLARVLLDEIAATVTQPWSLMEVCGRQAPTIRNGIDQLLPDEVTLIHERATPVCVTPLELIDKALAVRRTLPDVIFVLRSATCCSRLRQRTENLSLGEGEDGLIVRVGVLPA